jgi:hypothetical protein
MRILNCHNSAFFRLLAHIETVSVAQVPGFLVMGLHRLEIFAMQLHDA